MLHYFRLESLEMLSRPDSLTTYTEQTQAPSLNVLPVPRQYGRQGYKGTISHCTPNPARIASIWSCPSWLKCLQHDQVPSTHFAPQIVQFSMNMILLWLAPLLRSLGAHGLGCLLFLKGGPCPFLHMDNVQHLQMALQICQGLPKAEPA